MSSKKGFDANERDEILRIAKLMNRKRRERGGRQQDFDLEI